MSDKVLVSVDIIQDFCDEIERMMCPHEETYRGGAIWEICSACGEKWADDEGGKPEFKYPQCYHDGKAMIEAAPEPVGSQPSCVPAGHTYLPEITPDMWEDFNDTCLMTWHDGPQWTQIAVDFAAIIPVKMSEPVSAEPVAYMLPFGDGTFTFEKTLPDYVYDIESSDWLPLYAKSQEEG